MSGTVAPSFTDLLAAAVSRWTMAVVVVPAALAGGYWGVSALVGLKGDMPTLRADVTRLEREMERVERSANSQLGEAYKAIEAASKRGEERRQDIERGIRERTNAVDSRFAALETNLGSLTGGVIELRAEQRGIKAGVDRIEGLISGLQARPSATAAIPVLPVEPQRGPARAIDNLRQPWGSAR